MKKKTQTTKRRNPQPAARRKNPRQSITRGAVAPLRDGALALGGLVIARQIPQVLLGSRNAGWIGYLANALTAIAAGGALRLAKKTREGDLVTIGGMLYTIERLLNEQFSDVGRALQLSGLGDAHAVGTLRGIRPAYFPYPTVHGRDGQPQIPAALRAAAQPAPAAASGMGRYAGRYAA